MMFNMQEKKLEKYPESSALLMHKIIIMQKIPSPKGIAIRTYHSSYKSIGKNDVVEIQKNPMTGIEIGISFDKNQMMRTHTSER